VGLALNPGVSQNRDRNQFVPANAPAGQYSYNGYTGIYPNIIWDMDSFNFEKLGVNLDRGISDWLNWGEDFGNQAVALNTIIPQKFALSSAYPNPFNSATKLQYQLAEDCLVSLVIFDIRGREVVKLAEGFKPAGSYETTFNASGLPSGIYFASFKAGEFHQTQKLLLIK
jgi:hypothetical protein